MLLNLALAAAPPEHHLDWSHPVLTVEEAGDRVGIFVESEGPVELWVRAGRLRVQAEEVWRDGRLAVYFADLDEPRTQVGLESPNADAVLWLDWDLFLAGPREPLGVPPPTPGVLPDQLKAIGVVPRADWGAGASTCTSTEDDWYRMAIHHTAGVQTSGGSVQAVVKGLQAYAQGSGTYCDIPYQFLVGYDGTLWEGRPYDYTSGATGGGNNDGNIAISFLGCYDADGCSTTHQVTDAMMASGQLLVQTLASMHAVPTTEESIRGHRDWPGNATACPGDLLHPRLDELRAPLGPTWAALVVGSSFPLTETLVLVEGERAEGWIDLQNMGRGTWTPATTKLAPLPRDEVSPLQASDWESPTRIVGVGSSTAPGEVGRFTFALQPASPGEVSQPLGLVEEWVSWFADDGGPADDALVLQVRVEALPGETADTDETGGPSTQDSERAWVAPPGSRLPLASGCGPPVAGSLVPTLLWVVSFLLLRH